MSPSAIPVNPGNILGLDLELHVDALDRPIDWRAVFGNDHPVEIEIGSGKGRFLYEIATYYPERNFVGIERWGSRFQYTLQRVTKHALTNVRVARVDAIPFIREYVAPASVSAFHIYFPDPWPKRRHRKRRIFTPEFVEVLTERLRPEGYLYVATDFREYAARIRELLDACGALEQVLDPPKQVAFTNFEIKYQKQGRIIYRFVYRRKPERQRST